MLLKAIAQDDALIKQLTIRAINEKKAILAQFSLIKDRQFTVNFGSKGSKNQDRSPQHTCKHLKKLKIQYCSVS